MQRDKISSGSSLASGRSVKALYILAITQEKMTPDALRAVTHIAEGRLRDKDARFAGMIARMRPETMIQVANIEYAGPLLHTPQTMQTTLAGWLNRQYGVAFRPQLGVNFYPHGMRDPQGRENFFLFYFDTDE